MKKIAFLLMALLLLTLCIPGMAAAAEKSTEAIKGTPVIDGFIDDIWGKAVTEKLENWRAGTPEANANATVKTMWDEEYFYMLVEVTDSLVSSDVNSTPWFNDSVEFYMDEGFEQDVVQEIGDMSVRIGAGNEVSPGAPGGEIRNGILSGAQHVEGGYVVEIAVPWESAKDKVAVGYVFGYDVQVNDDATGTGTRDGIVRLANTGQPKGSNPSLYAIVTLADAPAADPVEETPSSGSAGEAAVNPDTGDNGLYLVWFGLLLLSAFVYMVSYRRSAAK